MRELPEPVFSSCLYQMLVDAVAVFLPNDPDGNAKLVFSILDCLPKANRVRVYALYRLTPKAIGGGELNPPPLWFLLSAA